MAPTYGLSSEAIYAIVFVIVFTVIAVIGVVYVWRSRRCCAAKSVVYRCARWLAALVSLQSKGTKFRPPRVLLQKRLSKCV